MGVEHLRCWLEPVIRCFNLVEGKLCIYSSMSCTHEFVLSYHNHLFDKTENIYIYLFKFTTKMFCSAVL